MLGPYLLAQLSSTGVQHALNPKPQTPNPKPQTPNHLQALSMMCTLALSIGGGIIAGVAMNLCREMDEAETFKDDTFWVTEEEAE